MPLRAGRCPSDEAPGGDCSIVAGGLMDDFAGPGELQHDWCQGRWPLPRHRLASVEAVGDAEPDQIEHDLCQRLEGGQVG